MNVIILVKDYSNRDNGNIPFLNAINTNIQRFKINCIEFGSVAPCSVAKRAMVLPAICQMKNERDGKRERESVDAKFFSKN